MKTLRNKLTRLLLFPIVVVLLGFLFYQYSIHFSGEGKDTPEEALPTDEKYEWIKGPKSENEQRYFFLANGNYFGTGIVSKNLKGWSSGEGYYTKIPRSLEDNKITSAFSDKEILFGLIKKKGPIKVLVNEKEAEFVELSSLPEDVLSLYDVKGCTIWYIHLDILKEKKNFIIKVIDDEGNKLNELSI